MTEMQQTEIQTQTQMQMQQATPAPHTSRSFTIADIFKVADLDIYEQMACIVLSTYQSEAQIPSAAEIARKGRMTRKQTVHAIQNLSSKKLLSSRIGKQLLGDYEDDRLSWAAKGLLLYFKNNPHADLEELLDLVSQSSDDESSVQEALAELKRYGYLDN